MSFPPKVKEDAMVACGRHCCLCRKFCGVNMEVHHIKQAADGGPDTFENAIPLCFDCHADVKAYNPRHPKGIRYTEAELVRHRDIMYAKVRNSDIITSNPETVEIDKKTYYRLREYLPDTEMRLIRDIDFLGSSFKFGALDKIEFFPRLIDDPVCEYLDVDLESAKAILSESIRKFRRDSVPYLHSDDGEWVRIPRDWELHNPEEYEKAAKTLNDDTIEIWHRYCDYIKLCRRKLLIEG